MKKIQVNFAFFYRSLVCFSTIPTVKFRNKFLYLNSRLGFLFTWKGGKKFVQFFIAIQNWSIKNRKIFTFLKEPVNFPIFFIKFLVQNCALCVKKKSENQIYIVYVVPTLFSMSSRIFFVKLTLLFFLWFVYKCIAFQYLSNKMKKKNCDPFRIIWSPSSLTYKMHSLIIVFI